MGGARLQVWHQHNYLNFVIPSGAEGSAVRFELRRRFVFGGHKSGHGFSRADKTFISIFPSRLQPATQPPERVFQQPEGVHSKAQL
jgi:hypothetical protein